MDFEQVPFLSDEQLSDLLKLVHAEKDRRNSTAKQEKINNFIKAYNEVTQAGIKLGYFLESGRFIPLTEAMRFDFN